MVEAKWEVHRLHGSTLLESRAQVPFNIIKNYDAELRFVCILKNLYLQQDTQT